MKILDLTLSPQLCSFMTSRVKLPLNEGKANLLLSLGYICCFHPFRRSRSAFQSTSNHHLFLGNVQS